MSLLSNRLRTITGENARFWKSVYRLFYYSANKKRIVKFLGNTLRFLNPKPSYGKWLSQTQSVNINSILKEINLFPYKPHLSVIIFGDNGMNANKTVATVKSQAYKVNKIFAVNPEVQSACEINSIHLFDLNQNECESDFILLLDAGDLLSIDCFYQVAKTIIHHPELKCIYFDTDKTTADGRRYDPDFKPGWSPDLIKQVSYISQAFFHRSLIDNSAIRENTASASSYYILNATKPQRKNVALIKRVLLSSADSIAFKKDGIQESQVVNDPLISIIIPTKNKAQLVKQCIDSVIEKSTYKNYEIIVVNNRSDEPALRAILNLFSQKKELRFKVIEADYDFNFSKIINLGVANSNGEYLMLLNNDIEVISNDWLEQMLSYALMDHVGVVGARLLYPDNSIQHAGIVLEPQNISRHIYLAKAETDWIENDALNVPRNYLALTAACIMISKKKFLLAGKFDPLFMVEFNDIDFCLRIFDMGYYNVFLPGVKLYHYESASRRHPHSDSKSYRRHLDEVGLMRSRWSKYINDDPYNTKRY